MIVSKPGGLTTSEIFAKNILMIILDPTPGLEEMLIPIITATGAAFKVEVPGQAASLVKKALSDLSAKTNVMESLKKVGKPLAAYIVGVNLVKKALENPAVNNPKK